MFKLKMWGFILAIFIFSLLTSTLNEAGLVNPVPEVNDFNVDNITTSEENVREVFSEDSVSPEKTWFQDFPGVDILIIVSQMFDILFKALGMTVYIQPTLLEYGMPDGLALLFQTVVTFMEGIFVFQVWRRFKLEN